jgi:hypothetical protein
MSVLPCHCSNGIGLCVDGGCVMPPSPASGLVGAPGAAPAPGPQTSLVFTGMTPGPVTASNSAVSSYVITVSVQVAWCLGSTHRLIVGFAKHVCTASIHTHECLQGRHAAAAAVLSCCCSSQAPAVCCQYECQLCRSVTAALCKHPRRSRVVTSWQADVTLVGLIST